MSVSVCSYLVIPVDNIFHHSFIPFAITLIHTFGVCGLLTKQPPDCSSSRQWDPSHCHHCLLYSGHCPAETPSPPLQHPPQLLCLLTQWGCQDTGPHLQKVAPWSPLPLPPTATLGLWSLPSVPKAGLFSSTSLPPNHMVL